MEMNAGDTAWVLMSAALVMLMTPALGFFYAGLVGKRNALSTLTHSFFILCLVSVQFVLVGYTLAFGPDHGGPQQEHQFGPAIFGKIKMGTKQAIKYNAAVLFGTTSASPRTTLRMQAEYEF